jgi:predicted DNA-binding mobile mystery protein A
MSQTALGKRLNVRASTVAKLENSERSRTIQLGTLQRAAQALNCDLVYALVPRNSLQSMVDDQRLRLFAEIVSRTDLHMSLEGQETSDPDRQHYLLRQAEDLIPDAQLWREG